MLHGRNCYKCTNGRSSYILGLDLGDVVNLFRQFVDGVLLLLAQRLDLLFALDLRFFEIATQLLHFLFTLLVDVNLANRRSISEYGRTDS